MSAQKERTNAKERAPFVSVVVPYSHRQDCTTTSIFFVAHVLSQEPVQNCIFFLLCVSTLKDRFKHCDLALL